MSYPAIPSYVTINLRFCCRCTYGCYDPPKVAGDGHQVELPKLKTLFDECDWQEFVSFGYPRTKTWDIEMRMLVLNKYKKRSGHVCGSNKFNAMYIDGRKIEDDTPADETGEILTKYSPQ